MFGLFSRAATLATLCWMLALSAPAARAQDGPMVWQAQYPLAADHPVVTEGWAPMAAAMQPDLDLQLRLIGPRLGTPAALEALTRGAHQMGLLALSSYPQDFPYWALLGELFLVGGESLAAAAAITELVMLDCPPCQQNMARRKLVFLGTYGAAPYVLIAPRPLTESHSLEGQILASPGSFWDRLTQHLGGSVGLPEADPREALLAGRVTALIDIPDALADPQLAKHALAVTKLPLGGYRGAGPFMVNRDAWRSLDRGQRRRMFAAAAAGLVRITDEYRRLAEADLLAAERRGVSVTEGSVLLQDRVRRFAAADQARVVASAAERFGIADADRFLASLKALYDKYAILTGPHTSQEEAISLLTSEIFDRLSLETYGLR